MKQSAIPVRLEQHLVIPVVSLPVLLVLKLFAWTDRKHEKRDAPDIHTLLRQYGDAGNEDRLYGEEINVLEAEGYDFELAGARLIARDASRMVSADTQKRVQEILDSDALMEKLTNQMIVFSVRNCATTLNKSASAKNGSVKCARASCRQHDFCDYQIDQPQSS